MTRSFGGDTFDEDRDGERLRAQLTRVYKLMHDGVGRTLGAIAFETGDPEASVSARLRDFRKRKFGGHVVERKYLREGLWEYRLLVRKRK
jgi:hypothetical protein